MGLRVIASDGEAVLKITEALHENGVAVLPVDRDLSGNGVLVTFFGEQTTMPAGPALLALRTGAALLPTCVYQRPDGRTLGVVGPPLTLPARGKLRDDLGELMQRVADQFEMFIREAPEQWQYGSLFRWISGTAHEKRLLSAWPIARHRNWVQRVTMALSDKELKRLHWSKARGCPFGEDSWVESVARRFDLEMTMRPRGRPRKFKAPK